MNFDEKFYSRAYSDVIKNNKEKHHYDTIGKKYNRIKSEMHFYSLYPDFNADGYYHLNKDLHKLNNEERLVHYHHHGKSEGRKYKTNINYKIKTDVSNIPNISIIQNQIKELNEF